MKETKIDIYFFKCKTIIFDEKVSAKFSTSGHYYITVPNINDKNENVWVQDTIVCFSDDLKIENRNKLRIETNYCQKFMLLLKGANVKDNELMTMTK